MKLADEIECLIESVDKVLHRKLGTEVAQLFDDVIVGNNSIFVTTDSEEKARSLHKSLSALTKRFAQKYKIPVFTDVESGDVGQIGVLMPDTTSYAPHIRQNDGKWTLRTAVIKGWGK